jgi:cytochrome c553
MKPHVDGGELWFDGRADREQNLEEPALEPRIALGMNLFFSNTDQKMSGHNVNVSCSTCHFDGRNDGLTWTFADGPRQTPSLAGDVSETEPVTWRDDVATVVDEVRLTSQGRMGGEGLAGAEAQSVADYVNWRRHLDLPNHGADNVIIAEGKEIFESEAAGCSDCHSGEQFTDSSLHRVRGKNVRTPTLRGVAATAPYFHDGSSASLGELLERSRDGSMGNTRHLSEAQMAALEAYLTSL